MKLYFIAAVYNEENEISDLMDHVMPLVDGYRIVDDGSTDGTAEYLDIRGVDWDAHSDFAWKTIPHTGLPETVKSEALKMVPDDSWVLMLDADERLAPETIESIKEFFETEEYLDYDYVYFQQLELIDGVHVRTFQKAKLFKKDAIGFAMNNIHADDYFIGDGTYKENWIVLHRKTTNKQIKREQEYLQTYKKLLEDGHIDEGRYNWLKGLHHYVTE
jgi:glycosyltransferase involved in cell wall biosynthesis